jgi:hypothetical protein
MLRAPYVFECAEDPGGHQKHIEIHPITLGMGGMGQDEAALTHHQKSLHFVKICQDMSRSSSHNLAYAIVVLSMRQLVGPAALELLQNPEPET